MKKNKVSCHGVLTWVAVVSTGVFAMVLALFFASLTPIQRGDDYVYGVTNYPPVYTNTDVWVEGGNNEAWTNLAEWTNVTITTISTNVLGRDFTTAMRVEVRDPRPIQSMCLIIAGRGDELQKIRDRMEWYDVAWAEHEH